MKTPAVKVAELRSNSRYRIEVATSYNKDSESTEQRSIVEIVLHDGRTKRTAMTLE